MGATGLRLPARYAGVTAIAHGGMGDVVRATDERLGRTVAIKVLAERYATNDEFRARFLRESQTAASLSNEPYVIAIYDVGESDDGLPFIVMEYLPGGTLADRLRDGPVDREQALRLARTGGGGTRRRPCQGDRPPGREAGEPPGRGGRHDPRLRLRDRPRRDPRHADRRRDGARLDRLHGARAGARRAGHPCERPLRARLRRVRAAHGSAAVRPRHARRRGDGARERGAAGRERRRAGAAARGRRRARRRPREAPERSPGERPRAGRSSARGAGGARDAPGRDAGHTAADDSPDARRPPRVAAAAGSPAPRGRGPARGRRPPRVGADLRSATTSRRRPSS